MAVLGEGFKMMFLGLIEDSFKDKEGKEVKLNKINVMDLTTNDIHQFSVSAKNEVLMKQIAGLKIAQSIQIIFALEFDKYAVAKKQNPSRFKVDQIYPA